MRGGVEGWGEKAYNCNWITIKIKNKKKKEREDTSNYSWDWRKYNGQLMAIPTKDFAECFEQWKDVGRTVWGPKVPSLKGTEASLSYVQCFLYLISSLINVYFLQKKNEWDITISNSMDGIRGYCAKWNKSVRERQYRMISLICRILREKNEQKKQKQTHSYREQTSRLVPEGLGEKVKGLQITNW